VVSETEQLEVAERKLGKLWWAAGSHTGCEDSGQVKWKTRPSSMGIVAGIRKGRKIKKVLYEPRNLIPKMKPKKKIRKY